MAIANPPVVGNWYRDRGVRQSFQVVAVDAEADTIELEYFDGTIDEMGFGDWAAMSVEASEAPQDWTGPFDDVERDDLGFTDTGMTSEDWHEALEGPPAEEPAVEAAEPEEAPLETAEAAPPEAGEEPDVARTAPDA